MNRHKSKRREGLNGRERPKSRERRAIRERLMSRHRSKCGEALNRRERLKKRKRRAIRERFVRGQIEILVQRRAQL